MPSTPAVLNAGCVARGFPGGNVCNHSKLELTRYHTPAACSAEPENPPPNTLGLHRVMFAVDDIDNTVARLRAHGAELLGEVAQYESVFRLCYLRGPAGIIGALAEQIG